MLGSAHYILIFKFKKNLQGKHLKKIKFKKSNHLFYFNGFIFIPKNVNNYIRITKNLLRILRNLLRIYALLRNQDFTIFFFFLKVLNLPVISPNVGATKKVWSRLR